MRPKIVPEKNAGDVPDSTRSRQGLMLTNSVSSKLPGPSYAEYLFLSRFCIVDIREVLLMDHQILYERSQPSLEVCVSSLRATPYLAKSSRFELQAHEVFHVLHQ